jgi:hypothetical protein
MRTTLAPTGHSRARNAVRRPAASHTHGCEGIGGFALPDKMCGTGHHGRMHVCLWRLSGDGRALSGNVPKCGDAPEWEWPVAETQLPLSRMEEHLKIDCFARPMRCRFCTLSFPERLSGNGA